MQLIDDSVWNRLRNGAIVSVLTLSLTACPGDDDDDSTGYEPPITNVAPTALAFGPAGLIPVGGTATLDGSASFDVDGDAIAFLWEWVSRPSGSNATLQDANTNLATFTPDVGGDYEARLTVSDGTLSGTDGATATVVGVATISPAAGPEGDGRDDHGCQFLESPSCHLQRRGGHNHQCH